LASTSHLVRCAKDIISQILDLFSDPNYFELVVDALVEFVSHPMQLQHSTTVCTLIPPIMSQKEEFMKALQGFFLPPCSLMKNGTKKKNFFFFASKANDQDYVTGYCRLLAAFGENYSHYLVSHLEEPPIKELLSTLLQCTNYPGSVPVDQEISFSASLFPFLFLSYSFIAFSAWLLLNSSPHLSHPSKHLVSTHWELPW